MNEREIADQVQKRAEELLGEEEYKPLDDFFVKQCLDANERGDGVMYATINRDRFLYNTTPKDGEWLVWKGNVWVPDDTRRSLDAVEKCAIEYQRIADQLKFEIEEKEIDKNHPEAWKIKLKEKYVSRIDRLRSAVGASKVLIWAPVVNPSMSCREEDFDKEPWLLPVRNGVIDLRTGVLTSGQPSDKLTRALDIEYDPRADYTPWQEFLDTVSCDQEVPAFIKRSLGYSITGHSYEQFIWVFIGPGRNGKGVLFNIISDILGPYYHEISRAMLLEQKNEPSPSAASEHLYSLLGKRIVVGAETNKYQKIDGAAVKSLTGTNKIKCRPNFKSEVVFDPTHSIFLQTNNLPVGMTKEFSLLQRLRIIEFPLMFVDDVDAEKKKYPAKAHLFRQKDPTITEKLKKCRTGILRWLVEGCLEWQKMGLAPPKTILDGVDILARAEDYIGLFYTSCLIYHPPENSIKNEKLRVPISAVYEAFRWWWNENMDERQQRTPAKRTITTALRDRGFLVPEVGGTVYLYNHSINIDIVSHVEKYIGSHGKQ